MLCLCPVVRTVSDSNPGSVHHGMYRFFITSRASGIELSIPPQVFMTVGVTFARLLKEPNVT